MAKKSLRTLESIQEAQRDLRTAERELSQKAPGDSSAQFRLLNRHIAMVEGSLAEVCTENAALAAEINKLRTSNVGLEKDNAELRKQPDRVELDALRGRAELADRNVERMETLLGVRGIPADQAVPAAADSDKSPQGLYERFKALQEQEKAGQVAPGASMAFYRRNKDAMRGH